MRINRLLAALSGEPIPPPKDRKPGLDLLCIICGGTHFVPEERFQFSDGVAVVMCNRKEKP